MGVGGGTEKSYDILLRDPFASLEWGDKNGGGSMPEFLWKPKVLMLSR